MFLKTLQIKGFKSFADTAELPLQPGVSVVVGPNGSGKSNVVDAIGWVLGAQAPSAVRSQKMDDVIFAGTTKRPALGRAEVSLTIDNSAGLLPIEFTEVTLSRLLFRTGDSEYSINGVPCRLLDIQELLSDSGVGRQQHVIISQGNIDSVLNARPEERRLIIEEAAGVLKFRRRKERAERRLASTEANLTRIQDLLREVRRQLRPLERQADAARRHGALVEELTILRLHLAGREIVRLRAQLERSDTEQAELRSSDQRVRAALSDLDARVVATEASLSALGGRDLGDSLVRYERLREKARGQLALLAERERGAERDLGRSVDAAVVSSLESERAQLVAEEEQIAADEFDLAAEQAPLATDIERLTAERAAFEAQWADGVAAPSGDAAEVRGELAALRASIERTSNDRTRLVARRAALSERVERLVGEAEGVNAAAEAAEGAVVRLRGRVEVTSSARTAAESEVEAAEVAATDAETEHSAWVARAEALSLALDEARQRAGAEKLADTEGVLGTLLDLVDVDAGWEEAFEAAAGEALGAVVVADPTLARRALDALESHDARGAVLALGAGAGARPLVVPDERSVRYHVRPRPGADAPAIAGILDRLLAGATVVEGSWSRALDHAVTHPDQVVITRRGDRFSTTGWRLRAAGAGATGAALDEAQARTAASAERRTSARSRVDSARAAATATRREEQQAIRDRDANETARRAHAEAAQRLERDLDEASGELESFGAHIVDLAARFEREQARVRELTSLLPELEAAEAELSDQSRRMAEARSELESLTASVSGRRADIDVRTAAVEERRRYVVARRVQVEERLSANVEAVREAARRRIELEARLDATRRLSAVVADRLTIIETDLDALRDERRRESDEARQVTVRLEELRRKRSAAESELEEVRARSQKLQIAEAETRMRLDAATESLRHELDSEPDAAIATACPEVPDGTTPTGRVRELERELRIMGPINPLALAEFEELSERHRFLDSQLEDIRQTRRELAKVIRAVDEEIVKVFAAAYADVSENFVSLFETLFPGGQGRLRLTEPDNLLETGIEIEARPSGKNVRKLSLLSGGERSLTALAYLFAVFRSRPSPFYVMDEVEAALDDVNLHRFLDLIHEFRSTAQLIIVSHQKRTMEAADVLFGVTMEPGGSSRVVTDRAASVLE